ncbi:hypothetical protein M501DRAFT_224619 [Patellaria atrata CBS 101060]|uniref:Uncharacterized protein n=1 Tax=Patellaria atrata CBS 101060 TaxID=1346257 RepID=A0A9P4S7J4_9PEZI|nr:hypothetical protein M501DRAFT_224619 [Patellaria atrata CBS 101060]
MASPPKSPSDVPSSPSKEANQDANPHILSLLHPAQTPTHHLAALTALHSLLTSPTPPTVPALLTYWQALPLSFVRALLRAKPGLKRSADEAAALRALGIGVLGGFSAVLGVRRGMAGFVEAVVEGLMRERELETGERKEVVEMGLRVLVAVAGTGEGAGRLLELAGQETEGRNRVDGLRGIVEMAVKEELALMVLERVVVFAYGLETGQRERRRQGDAVILELVWRFEGSDQTPLFAMLERVLGAVEVSDVLLYGRESFLTTTDTR